MKRLLDVLRPRPRRLVGVLPFLVALALAPSSTYAAKVTAHTGKITLPTYGWAANKHPHFRGTDGRNIYPYPMLDFLSRDKTNRTYRTVVLENEYLRITFLPELGGKIHEVLDKTTGQPMFYVNHVIKPGLIGQCGAWTSGGVEWNTGPQGHTVSCMQPVDVVILPPEKDGSRSVAIGETERIYRTKWTVVVTLRPGRSFIEERIRIYNPTETVRPYYFWNCTAVPNTPGFRFIYPMTLGCDHAGEKFFNWPVDHGSPRERTANGAQRSSTKPLSRGKDLTRGTNYQDASSIFAWHCDQDFFGSYNDDLDRGVVAFANHHQLPGKKAWTWGHGGFGKMHQMDLTDDDGPYNEVQTGPLLTQAQVGRLDPCEAVEWKEWWYPIHGLGGFTFANKDVAVNVDREGSHLRLRLIGTANWNSVEMSLSADIPPRSFAKASCRILATKPVELKMPLTEWGPDSRHLAICIRHRGEALARFEVPLELPERKPPEKAASPETATQLAQAGWEDFLFARFSEAEKRFRDALGKDGKCVEAQTGLAFLKLDSDPEAAANEARAALTADPDKGLARFALAVAEMRAGDERAALDSAWKASLDPATAVPGRALVAKLLIRRADWTQAAQALSEQGPWQSDPVCRNRLAFALLQRGDRQQASRVAAANLELDPLDGFARRANRLALRGGRSKAWPGLSGPGVLSLFELTADYAELGQVEAAWDSLVDARRLNPSLRPPNPLSLYWQAYLTERLPLQINAKADAIPRLVLMARAQPVEGIWPYRIETMEVLKQALSVIPDDGNATILLGHLLFHLGRHAEGRAMWKRAAELGAEPVIAYRALGMAAKTLDNDLPSARDWLTKANQADPKDSIVARDLANVLFAISDKAESDAEKRALATEARDRLQAAFAEGKGRSDFVALLARAQNRLDEFAETARMLDTVRVTIWEGAHEVHDLFVQSHLALGETYLKAGRAAEALAEFNRALEYPANLATGKLENAREAHINFARGNALAALGRRQEAAAAWKLAAEEPESKDKQIEEARTKAKEALGKVNP